MIDETGTSESGNNERIGFCQDCGRSLTRESVSRVGSAVYCGPCFKARNAHAAAGAPPPPPPYGAGPVPPPAGAGPVYTEPFPPVGGNSPSPVLAAMLGFIPGVGAMYNGQFAKGIAHIVIFALLQSLARMSDFFGFLVAGWVFYQAFEAYHTAKARRDGMPLPDPLGLNNIGNQVGIHFRGTRVYPPNPGQPTNAPGWTGFVPAQQPIVTPPPVSETPVVDTWGSVSAVEPPPSPYSQTASAWTNPAYVAPPPVGQPWASAPASYPPPPPVRVSRFPAAALWLIGFGVLFCILNYLPALRFSIHKVFPFLLMGLAVGMFVRRMTATGGLGPYDGETETYTPRLVCSLRAPVVLFTVGVLWALAEFGRLYFHQTWPVIVIVLGLMMLLERSIGTAPVVIPPVPVAGAVPSSDASAVDGDGKGI